MQYFMIEYKNEDVDEPWRVILELDDQRRIQRQVNCYRMGLEEAVEVEADTPTDVEELAGLDGVVTVLNRLQFEDMWDHSHYMPDTFMGLFY